MVPQPPPGPPSRVPISQSLQPDRWPGTRWQHQRAPDHQSSCKDQTRPCGVGGGGGGGGGGGVGGNSGHAATCPITDNSVTYSHQYILFQQQSYFRRCKHKTFHCLFISNIEVGTEWRRLLCSHQLVVLEHPSWRRPILIEVVSI